MVCLGYLLSQVLLLVLVDAEKLHHNRDFSDIQQFSNNQARPIQTLLSAKEYLFKYGWIKPVNWDYLEHEKEQDTVPPDIFAPLTEGYVKSRNVEKSSTTEPTMDPGFSKALKHFQEVNKLPVTGILDDATKTAMNRPRCGVPDYKVSQNDDDPGDKEEIKANSAHNTSDSNGVYNKSTVEVNSTNITNSSGINFNRTQLFLQKLVEHSRKKRSNTDYIDNSTPGLGFSKPVLKWRLLSEGYSTRLPPDDQRETLKQAFRRWSEVIPLNFEEDLRTQATQIDIKMGFGTRKHLGCSQVFDGTGQVYAHAWHLGDVHFDDDEHFVLPKNDQGISLLKVAVHEIGHVLGLSHINRPGSVMQANYIPEDTNLELDWMDRKAIQQIYGSCENSFSTVFDWVYTERSLSGDLVYRFNTYFFRNSWYWMYENRNNRTRYGDPILLTSGWRGLPSSNIDAFVHVWTLNKDYTLFFKGTQYWRYNNEKDEAYKDDPEGGVYPKLISEGFPGISSPIDTAYFDKRDHNIYFFRGNDVTAFNVDHNSKVAGYPKRTVDVFPPVSSNDHPVGNLDAAYFSYYYQAIYFFKDNIFWRVVDEKDKTLNHSLPHNGLFPNQRIKDHWFDICDVDPSMMNMVLSSKINN
ncbi:matrix metalloproteinase-21-like [Erpetoichthys calabaricus]|uniref:matrix metalloproteinase-21-like n=1 Tax=Erpetoichthys calabaricus TaxID=27687 RepID=UPI00223455DD|nr:matrix metalloproteinase-21-like [Erpetoichthys calabaricus]